MEKKISSRLRLDEPAAMTLEPILAAYGYPILYLGTILEGETFVIISVILCQTGHLKPIWVVGTAFLGAISGDLLCFLLGRYGGANLVKKRPYWQRRTARAARLLGRHQSLVVISYRFFYGLRAVIPFMIGMTNYSFGRFILLSSAAALVRSITISVAGLVCGKVLILFISDMKHYQLWLFGGLGIFGLLWWSIYHFKHRQRIRPD
jgi:membrane protein DedA with SNARE-associated domain